MEYKNLLLEKKGGILTVTLNRPKQFYLKYLGYGPVKLGELKGQGIVKRG